MENKHIYEWFHFGDTDLKVAQHLASTLYPPPLEVICYHCQQAVEKYLKGYLVFCGAEAPPKIHNLMALCTSCSEHDNRFDTIVGKCNVLNAYAVQPRYPDEMYIDESQMKTALLFAGEIREFEPLADCRKNLDF
jgi:HEPN domain-containing protein